MNTRIWLIALLLAPTLFLGVTHCGMDPKTLTTQSGEPKSNTDSIIEKLSYPELVEKRAKYIKDGHTDMVLKYTERMVKLCDDGKELATLTLEAGDMHFAKGNLTSAEQYYSEFSLIFQGNQKAEYASYKSIECSFKRTFDFNRDQTKTESTIEMANKFLEKPSYTTYLKEVEQIRTDCYKKLAESEIYICDFYIKKPSLRSAERRLDTIKTEWLTKLPEIAPQVAQLEVSITDLRTTQGKALPTISTVATAANDELPHDESVKVAAGDEPAQKKRRMADRF